MTFTRLSEALSWYADILREAEATKQARQVMRELCLRDLFFLLYHVCNRRDIGKQWLFERCQEVQGNPNGRLDLWAREHGKSSIVTFGLTIQDVLADPEITIGIFSITRPTAKDFLGQIKIELESNQVIKDLFPDVLYDTPQKQAPSWSLDDGLVVRRKGNPKEATIEAHGLIDSMPTGKHFQIRIYDDVIDERNVTNPDMIRKAIKGWELSLNLGSQQPAKRYGAGDLVRYVGTRYHQNDPYSEILRRGAAIARLHPATVGGKIDGEPVLLSREVLDKKRREMGPYVFSAQLLLDPTADEVQGFKLEWLRYFSRKDVREDRMNLYLLCDPANSKKKENDYTVMAVLGLAADRNFYLVDGIRDRLNLTERTNKIFEFHRRYLPSVVGYEQYGMQADIEHIKYVQEKENYRFDIRELGGWSPKVDRIRKLVPIFEQGRFYIPTHLHFTTYDRKTADFTRLFIDEEFLSFPVGAHDDMLDCCARILDSELGARWPMLAGKRDDSITLGNRRSQGKQDAYSEVYA